MSETSTSVTGSPEAPTLLRVASQQETVDEQDYDARLLARLWPWVKPHAGLFGIALALMPIAAVASSAQPLMLKRAIDAALISRDASRVSTVIGYFAIAIGIDFVARVVQMYTLQLAGQRATADLRRDLFKHVQRLSVGYFDRTPIGRVVTRITNDIDGLLELFASGAITAFADILLLIAIIGFMFYVDAKLAAVSLVALPILGFFVNGFRRKARHAFRSIRVLIAELNTYLSEQVQGLAVVQAYGREVECKQEYDAINAEHREANYIAIRYDALLYSVVESMSVACIAVVLWFAAAQAAGLENPAESAAWVGTVVAFYDYIQRFFVPIRDLSTKYTVLQSSLASIERIVALLDVKELDAPQREPALVNVEPGVAIAFQNVHFGYRRDHPVLHGVDFVVREGERVAIVGATGSGKTTTTGLLLRFYEHDQGVIAVDGRDVRDFAPADLRRRFAMVPQDVFLFRGTVADNVALGAANVDRERVEESLRRVGALDLVLGRGGIDAAIDERGQNWSAGERQLLALARALYHDAPYLILDEATANVDSETEARLDRASEVALRGRTSIVIAHRLSTVRNANRILVFHHGRIVEEGSHADLIAKNGVYARLHRLQFGDAMAAAE
jgi:ATP-binding cassette subfamily B multidrug efflux pump